MNFCSSLDITDFLQTFRVWYPLGFKPTSGAQFHNDPCAIPSGSKDWQLLRTSDSGLALELLLLLLLQRSCWSYCSCAAFPHLAFRSFRKCRGPVKRFEASGFINQSPRGVCWSCVEVFDWVMFFVRWSLQKICLPVRQVLFSRFARWILAFCFADYFFAWLAFVGSARWTGCISTGLFNFEAQLGHKSPQGSLTSMFS